MSGLYTYALWMSVLSPISLLEPWNPWVPNQCLTTMRGSLILLPLAEKEILCKVIFARARGGRSQHLWAEREIRYLWVQLCVRRLYHMILPDTTAAAGQKGTSGFFKKKSFCKINPGLTSLFKYLLMSPEKHTLPPAFLNKVYIRICPTHPSTIQT